VNSQLSNEIFFHFNCESNEMVIGSVRFEFLTMVSIGTCLLAFVVH
jgi:hypothetical protein